MYNFRHLIIQHKNYTARYNSLFKDFNKAIKMIYEPLENIKYSIIRAIAEKVALENKHLPPDKQIINLTMGQNFIGDPTPVIKKINILQGKRIPPFLYAPSLGTFEAREAIAFNFYKLWYNVTLSPEDIMITDGGMGAIRNALGAIINDGDIVIIDPLTFIYSLDTLTVLGRKYRLYVLDASPSNNYIPTPESAINYLQELASRYKDKNIVYYTQFGFNPIGAFRKTSDLRQIVEFIDDTKNVYLINDIVYHLIRFDSFELPLATYLSDSGDRIVDCETLSKPFSLMGLRVGAMITRDKKLFNAAAKVQQYTIVSPNIIACEIWKVVSNPDNFDELRRQILSLNKAILENFEIMERYLTKMGLRILSPKQGTLYILIETPINSEKFVNKLIEKARVAIVPGTAFEVKPKYGLNLARITISFPKEKIKLAAERMYKYVISNYS